MVVFIVIYCLFLIAYFITRPGNENTTSKKIWTRAINKYILATMYLVYAIICFQKSELLSFHLVLMLAYKLYRYEEKDIFKMDHYLMCM